MSDATRASAQRSTTPWVKPSDKTAKLLGLGVPLEMAQEFGLGINPTVTVATDREVSVKCNAYDATDFKTVVALGLSKWVLLAAVLSFVIVLGFFVRLRRVPPCG